MPDKVELVIRCPNNIQKRNLTEMAKSRGISF